MAFAKEAFLFTPLQIPGCEVWLDAADSSTFTYSSGSNISVWQNKAVTGNNFTTVSGTPTYTTDGALSIVNIPVAAILQCPNSLTITTSSAFFVVCKLTSTSTSYPMVLALPDNNNGDYSIRYSGSVVNYGNSDDIGNGNYYTNGSVNTGASFLNQYVIIDTTTATRAAVSRVSISGTFSTRYFIGTVAEVIIYPGGISSTDRTLLQGYLAGKWGLQTFLPGAHAYKSLRPAGFTVQPPSYPLRTKLLNTSITFLPTQVSGCTMWFDGADPSATGVPPANGSLVSTWVDKSGTGNTLTAAASQPTYTTAAQNGQGCLTFNGTQNIAKTSLSASSFAGTAQNISVFIVFSLSNTNNSSSYSCPFCWANGGGVPRIAPTWEGSAGWQMDVGLNSPFRTSFTSPVLQTNNTFYLSSYWKNGGSTQLNINGSNGASATGQDTGNLSAYSYDFNVGNGYSSSSYWMKGNIGEIIFYNTTLESTQIQQIEGYLAWKWGIQTQLPAAHSYKSAGPNLVTPTYRALQSFWQPTTYSGCSLWLDAADVSSITLSGSNISQLNDKSGNFYNLTQGTAGNQPQKTGNYISFASNRYFNIPQAAINNASTWSLTLIINPIASMNWILVKQYDGVNTYNVVSMTNNTTNGGMNQAGASGYLYVRTYNQGSQATSGTALTLSSLKMITMSYDGSNLYIYLNGALLSTTAGIFAIQNQVSASNFTLGGWVQSGSLNDSGVTNFQLGELLFYNNTLTNEQRQKLEGYLAWKWGLQTQLPGAHPHAKIPPPPL